PGLGSRGRPPTAAGLSFAPRRPLATRRVHRHRPRAGRGMRWRAADPDVGPGDRVVPKRIRVARTDAGTEPRRLVDARPATAPLDARRRVRGLYRGRGSGLLRV